MRAVMPLWVVCLVLIAGCPKDDDAGGGPSGGSGGDSGDGDGDGDGGSGEGGDSGEGGTAGEDEPMETGTPEDAASGMCGMMDDLAGCTGIEAYQACLDDECGFAQCYTGPCAEHLECLRGSDNACTAASDGTCEAPAECTDCITADQNCIIACFSTLDCGEGGAGAGGDGGAGAGGDGGDSGDSGEAGTGSLPEGTCDDLDACCASLPEDEAMVCQIAADAARMDGDFTCAVYIDAFCPADA